MKGKRLLVGLLSVCLMVVFCAGANAQRSKGQKKLAAIRAARLDAMRKLVEHIKGMRIESDTTVKDFALESDIINTRAVAFLKGHREVGKPKYDPEDGTAQVTLEVTVAQIILNLKAIKKGKYKDGKFKGVDFEKIKLHTKKRIIRAVGDGTDVDPAEDLGTMSGNIATGGISWKNVPGWQNVPGRERLKAIRAATLDAYRKLAERIKGLRITSESTVEDFALASDEINSELNAFIRGVKVVGKPRYLEDGIVEVKVQATTSQIIAELKKILKGHYHGNDFHGEDFEKIKLYTDKKVFTEVGQGALAGDYAAPAKEVDIDIDIEEESDAEMVLDEEVELLE